uniref:Uncharacterized protein n=1 Tax=Pithovirus LCPAC406 TaxID=2506599 RepID=A0A481ZF27_9VIRU|nr:MAG: hypothetical protein LCPAC406_02690 [Pithovirus LCPAC406]
MITGEGFDDTARPNFLRLLRNVVGLTTVGQGGQGKHSLTTFGFDCTFRVLFLFLLDTIRELLTDIIFG